MPAGEHNMLRRSDALLVVIDVQEAFRGRIDRWDDVVGRIASLARGCELLDVPVVVAEMYPRGLGPTVEELAEPLARAERLEKRAFSVAGAEGFDDLLGRLGRSQALICGIESHVCVHQTAADLLARGLDVHVALDAISSQRPDDARIGEQRLLADGARPSGVELALFELLETSTSPVFKPVSALVKELHAEELAAGTRTGSA